MGKKGKQKAQVEEEQEEDGGLGGIGSLWDEVGGVTEVNDDWDQVGGDRYDTWANQAEPAPQLQEGWGGHGGGGGGGKGRGGMHGGGGGGGGRRRDGSVHQSNGGWGAPAAPQAKPQRHRDQDRGRQGDKARKNNDEWNPVANAGWGVPAEEPLEQGRGRHVERGRKVDDAWGVGGNDGWGVVAEEPRDQGRGRQGRKNEDLWGAGANDGWNIPAAHSHEQGRGRQGEKGRKDNDGWGAGGNVGWGASADDPTWGDGTPGEWGVTESRWGEQAGGDYAYAQGESLEDGWGGGGKGGGGGGAGKGNKKASKVTVIPPSAVEPRRVLSPNEHHSLLNALLNLPNKQESNQAQHDQNRGGGKKGRKKQKPQHQQSLWPTEEEPEDYGYGQVDDEGGGQQSGWSANVETNWGGPNYAMPSKTFALAADGRSPIIQNGTEGNPYMDTRFIESHGEALSAAHKALYSKERLARNRIHWLFSPQKDERVASLLEWIQKMSYGLASLGLHKFLQTQERGALISNADYRPWESPAEPAFDWVTFDRVQATQDRTLQESLAFYDPSTQVLVFVFLLSKSGNSMAIWRRKLVIPNNLRLTYGREITQAKAGLRKEYPIHIDEIPVKSQAAPAQPAVKTKNLLSKRKWLRWRL